MKKLGLFLALIFTFSVSAFAEILQVPSPYISTIQGGIDLAENGDTVLVLAGVYHENINFRGKNIVLASNFIFDQNTSTIHNTIIDGSDTATVVTFNSNEDSTASIQGFTIRHGCYYEGAGILCKGSSVHIAYNIIKENSADPFCSEPDMINMGGGVGAGIFCNDCFGIIEHNYIINNRCLGGEWGGGFGGGIFNTGRKSLIIRYNLIAWNQVDVGGNDFEGGGGILCGDSSTTLIYNNTIIYNQAQDGGGIYNFSLLPNSKIFNNIIAFNSEGIRVFDLPGYIFSPLIAYNNVWENDEGNFYDGFNGTGDTTWGFNS
ncbi:MAG: hypothetical protein OEV55_08905, partial [candidate division Zixibacteria bacterium]|nr:hypothetical protein [candidate division Zixibacteria bacterium]